jgi:hypothetical protein
MCISSGPAQVWAFSPERVPAANLPLSFLISSSSSESCEFAQWGNQQEQLLVLPDDDFVRD